MNNVTA